MFDVESIRRDFPILGREVYGKPLVYLDNAATTQNPQCQRPPRYTFPFTGGNRYAGGCT